MTLTGPSIAEIIAQQMGRTLSGGRDELAELIGVSVERVAAFLRGEVEPTHAELRELSRYLEVDLASYDPEEDASPDPLPSISTLLKASENTLTSASWPSVVEAAEVARAIVRLESWLGLAARYERLRSEHLPDGIYGEPDEWREAQRLAESLRKGARGPIASMRAFCEELGVAIIETLLPESVSALCLADEFHGPTIILNRQGHNESPLARRFTLAHELCHVLYDRHLLEGLRKLDRYSSWFEGRQKPPVERRADAFAIHLLVPEAGLHALWPRPDLAGVRPERRLRSITEQYGVSFTAARGHAINLHRLARDRIPGLGPVDPSVPPAFQHSEDPPTSDACFDPVPLVRRGRLLELALRACQTGVIGRSYALELLGIDGQAFHERYGEWCARLGIEDTTAVESPSTHG